MLPICQITKISGYPSSDLTFPLLEALILHEVIYSIVGSLKHLQRQFYIELKSLFQLLIIGFGFVRSSDIEHLLCLPLDNHLNISTQLQPPPPSLDGHLRKLNLEMTITVHTSLVKEELRLGLARELVFYDYLTLILDIIVGA